MTKLLARFPFSILATSAWLFGILVVTYIGLIAMVMSYAALTVEFSQSVKRDGAIVAGLESKYLAKVAEITSMDYSSAGYAKPVATTFVPAKSVTALR